MLYANGKVGVPSCITRNLACYRMLYIRISLFCVVFITGLYSGLTPTVLAIVPQMGINFLVFELLLSGVSGQTTLPNSQHSTEQPTALWKVGACGSAAGVISKLFVYPMVSSVSMYISYCLNSTTIHHLRFAPPPPLNVTYCVIYRIQSKNAYRHKSCTVHFPIALSQALTCILGGLIVRVEFYQ